MTPRSVATVATALTLALLPAACTSGSGGAPPPASSGSAATAPASPAAVLPVSLVDFGSYTAVPLDDPNTPAYPGPAAPTTLTGVTIAPAVQQALAEPGVSATLTRQGFVVVPADLRQLHFGYAESSYEGWPVYVTTDAAYHVWHQLFAKVLRTTEEQKLLPTLRTLVGGTLDAAHAQTVELAGTPLAEAATRSEQLYQVVAAELGLKVALGPLARQEKALVDGHAGMATSPLLGVQLDYSLMTPRGHYTRTPALTRYFVAMSVLGQARFDLAAQPLRVGLLAARALLGSADRTALWRAVYEPTAFLVGLADDYTPVELNTAAATVAPAWPGDPSAFADDATVAKLASALTATRPVRIDPEKASVRIMGARFVLDSYLMDQLIDPSVGFNSAGEKRLLPSALDVAAVLGSTTAHRLLVEAGATDYRGYPQQFDALTALVSGRPGADWGGTVYDAWLYALQPVLADHGTAYPSTMRGPAWAAKGLQSGLGSYAELKHDTILYTKQAVAEGGGDQPTRVPRNWVEPEPVAFARLAAAVDLLRTGLARRGLLTAEQTQLAADVQDLFGFLARIARDELAGTPIAAADNQRLGVIGETLEGLWFRTAETADGEVTGDTDAALIADIASGPTQVLEVAIGRFDRIYVLVPDDAGRFQVGVGAVFSYYEFAQPAGQRLTDEAWRSLLDRGSAPARPGWQAVMLPRR
jgi:hypothetical protein